VELRVGGVFWVVEFPFYGQGTMLPQRFDVCILGAGPAGYAAAMRAHDLGKNVLLVEKDRVGGTGIHHGALSSKTMWHLSNDYAVACRTDRGYTAQHLEVSYSSVMTSVAEAVTERRNLLLHQLDKLHAGKTEGRIFLRQGNASFVDPHTIEIHKPDGSTDRYQADNFLIATGSTPRIPSGIEVDGKNIMTSDHIESLQTFPKSMVIIGAGVVGCEYATIFANFRNTRINIIDRKPRILPYEDEDIANIIATRFEDMGINIHREASLVSLRAVDGGVEYVLDTPEKSGEVHQVERALISIGRIPNTKGIGLEHTGVKLDRNGGIECKDTRSNISHIYAAGDASMDIALVNVAELEGRHAVELMFGLEPKPIRYEALCAIMFFSPEVASVGLNEQQAKDAKIPYMVGVIHNQLINRNIAMRNTGGFIKLLATRESPHHILGMRVVGPEASSAIQGIAFLIDQKATLEDIDYCVHPHPAITEGVQECARLMLGRSIHKTSVFGPSMLRFENG
jgi:dihydrolipoamide dehydrogenase